jgi:hypothetical protein
MLESGTVMTGAPLPAAKTERRSSWRYRSILRLHFVEGMNLARIGALDNTLPITVRAPFALAQVLSLIHHLMVEQLGVPASEDGSFLRIARNRLDLGIERFPQVSPTSTVRARDPRAKKLHGEQLATV